MTQLPATLEYQPTSYYKWGQGQPQEHCVGTSCDNLVSMSAQQSQATSSLPFHRLQQHQQPPAPPGIPKPRRSDPAPESPPSGSPPSSPGTSPSTSGGLDQFAPMLASNPLQQLPLLPAAASIPSADMVRVAAWLLDQAGEQERPAGASAANDLAADGPTVGQGWGQAECSSADCEGFRATGYFEEARRRSLDSVVRPHLAAQQHHGNTLNNNFVAALY